MREIFYRLMNPYLRKKVFTFKNPAYDSAKTKAMSQSLARLYESIPISSDAVEIDNLQDRFLEDIYPLLYQIKICASKFYSDKSSSSVMPVLQIFAAIYYTIDGLNQQGE